MERHRSAGDLLVLMLPGLDTAPQAGHGGPAPGPDAVADGMVQGNDDCLRITTDGAANKSCTVVETMIKLGLDAFRCFGYGNHQDSLRTLGVVGNPRVLDGDPELTEYARTHGWPVIDTSAPPTS